MTKRLLVPASLCALSIACQPSAPQPFPALIPTTHAPAPAAPPVEIVPGAAVGPIRLGMTRAEVEALRILRPHPRWANTTVPYQVVYDETDHVALVGVSLLRAPADVRVEGTVLPRGTTFLKAREILGGDCTQPEIGFGGGSFSCRKNLVEVTGGSGSPDEIWIATHAAR